MKPRGSEWRQAEKLLFLNDYLENWSKVPEVSGDRVEKVWEDKIFGGYFISIIVNRPLELLFYRCIKAIMLNYIYTERTSH